MAKVLSDRTAEWLKNQINSRDLTSKSRKGVIIGSGGGSDNQVVLATVISNHGGGVYTVRIDGQPNSVTVVTVVNSMYPCDYYANGDRIVCYKFLLDSVAGDITNANEVVE